MDRHGILGRQHQPAFQAEMLYAPLPKPRFLPLDGRVACNIFLFFRDRIHRCFRYFLLRTRGPRRQTLNRNRQRTQGGD